MLLWVSLLSSVSFSSLWVALPYLGARLGASQTLIGSIGAIYMAFYVFGMFASRRLFGRFHPRRMASGACLALLMASAAMIVTPNVLFLLAATAVYGLSTSWLWPPLMGWLSTGREGAALNSTLGWFNAAWSFGMILGPKVGGELYDVSFWLPFVTAAGLHAVCAILLWFSRDAPAGFDESADSAGRATAHPQTPPFRAMSRVALFCGYAVVGMVRFQMPDLATELNVSASEFGTIGSAFSGTQTLGFVLLGLTAAWHHRRRLLWLVQIFLAGVLLIAYGAAGSAHLMLCVILVGPCVSFVYASHLYYGVSGGRNRPRLMAVHETLLSSGFLLGSLGGGVVADLSNNRWPYVVMCGMVVAGVAVQMGIKRLVGEASLEPE